ncbi:origin of replication complex subunit 3 [Diospyros lotus]|uniref:origin of replication complex subunit 3 n=1 Tax=Diospyros lotus TaxID=55363 RepID=UPI002256851B|nr:origin of replication complex subunit 3 [Diospyros lotus]
MESPCVADSPTIAENSERNFQPFFVLHKATHRNSERKLTARTRTRTRTRRKIDLTSSSVEQSEGEFGGEHIDNNNYYNRSWTNAFDRVWHKFESTIRDVLRNITADAFNDIHSWIQESFDAIRSCGIPHGDKSIWSYPIVTDPLSKQIHTGLMFTKNIDLVDDLLTFEELGLHLKSHGCHVANLSSDDFSAKNGIAGCFRALLRQFLMVGLDAADMSVLVSWYIEQGKHDKPVVVIIDDMEKCCGSVLSDFILMLSEWVVKIPVILIIGVATTINALRSILPSNALQYLCCRKFSLGSPTERMDAIIEAVLAKQHSGFSVGHRVAIFLRNYFLRQDGTLASFVRALKISIAQHISVEPLSIILGSLFNEDGQDLRNEIHAYLPEMQFKRAFDLPSCKRSYELAERNEEMFAHGLSDLRRLQISWSSVVMCLYEAGKSQNMTLLDLYCEALDPELCHSSAFDPFLGSEMNVKMSSSDHHMHGQLRIHAFVSQVIRKVRDLPAVPLFQLLNSWEKLTVGMAEIHAKVRELQCRFKFDNDKGLKEKQTNVSKRQKTRSNLNVEKGAKGLNEEVIALVHCMVKNYMLPIECIPFHEIACLKNVDKLQLALIGDPRRTIQVDLLEFYKFLKCNCCSKSDSMPFSSMHDTSIMYMLAQEHGDLINLHDWYQSFKATILPPRTRGKHRLKQSPSPKKRKDSNESQNKSEASIQAQFCRAVTELQITGLLRMPSKRRPDYVQRVAFGL